MMPLDKKARADFSVVLALVAGLIHDLAYSGIISLDRVRAISSVSLMRVLDHQRQCPELHGQLRLPFQSGDGGAISESADILQELDHAAPASNARVSQCRTGGEDDVQKDPATFGC